MPTTVEGGNGRATQADALGLTANQFSKFQDIVANAMYTQREFFKRFLDPRRDIDDECGFPKGNFIDAQFYEELFAREAVAARVVEVMARECWQVQPLVFEVEDAEEVTDFELGWDELSTQLRSSGEPSYYGDEAGSPIWEALKRADETSGRGRYGVIVFGLDDGEDLSKPAKHKKDQKLTYLQVLPESLAVINRFETDKTHPRYGKPIEYGVTLNDPQDNQGQTGSIGIGSVTERVHWTRVQHIADLHHQASSNEVFAIPRMRPVLNNLLGLRKLYGGSPEMYWRGAFPGYTLETDPKLGGDVVIDKSHTRDQMEQWMNGLQRYLILNGVTLKGQPPQVVDPTPQIDAQITAICIKLGIPKRVFMGSERGELASSQDDQAWNDRLVERQNSYVTPRIIVPFVNRLINLGVLPPPTKKTTSTIGVKAKPGFHVEWPSISSKTDLEKAQVLAAKTGAYAAYIQGGVEALIPPLDFLTKVDDMDEDEAQAILEEAAKIEEEKMAEQEAEAEEAAKLAEEQGLEPAPPEGFAKPEQQQPIKVKDGEKLVLPDGKRVTR